MPIRKSVVACQIALIALGISFFYVFIIVLEAFNKTEVHYKSISPELWRNLGVLCIVAALLLLLIVKHESPYKKLSGEQVSVKQNSILDTKPT